MIYDSKTITQKYSLCVITLHDVTTFAADEMVQNTKTWISQERYMTLPWNKQILEFCLKD